MSEVPAGWGAYGLEIDGLDEPARFLGPAAPEWPPLRIDRLAPTDGHRRPTGSAVAVLQFDDRSAELWLSDRESVELDRTTMCVRFITETRLSDDLVAHPYVAVAAMIANHWLGRQVLHGGGLVQGGRVWGVLGTKEAGKSSTLAWFANHGHPIFSDDLLVASGSNVFAGPRSIDLREDAAPVLGGTEIHVGSGRRRWRLRPAAVPGCAPLAGLVHLEWGDEVRLEPVPPVDRLLLLIGSSALGADVVDAAAYLDLASLPTWRLLRPRRLDVLDEANTRLLREITRNDDRP